MSIMEYKKKYDKNYNVISLTLTLNNSKVVNIHILNTQNEYNYFELSNLEEIIGKKYDSVEILDEIEEIDIKKGDYQSIETVRMKFGDRTHFDFNKICISNNYCNGILIVD